METPKLRNAAWQAPLDEALSHLNRFQDQLNAISEDLRTIEKTLIESGFRIETSVDADAGDRLAWTETGKNAWRICLVEWTSENEGEIRPLIETPAADRWRLAQSIPTLLTEIAAVASRAPGSTEPIRELTDDDIPF